MIETLWAFAGATMILALSPGPDNIYVLTQGMSHGTKAGLATTAGLISGCIVHTTLIAFGVSALIVASPILLSLIKLFGCSYLLYLAFQVYRSDGVVAIGNTPTSKKSYLDLFKIGVVMNLSNPKVILFFLAFFPAFLWNPEENTVFQFYVLGLVFMGVSFLIFSIIALLAGRIAVYFQDSQRAGIVMKWLQIIVFLVIAIFIWL